jgi:hypothetical protein
MSNVPFNELLSNLLKQERAAIMYYSQISEFLFENLKRELTLLVVVGS